MSEMIERVARAMFQTAWPEETWLERDSTFDFALWRAMARAAIGALSEAAPTPEMLESGEEFCTSNGMAGCWHNMLIAALK